MTTTHDLDAIASRLDAVAPPLRNLTQREIARQLAPALRRMRARGHSAQSIRAALLAEGVRISLRAIRAVLAKPSCRASSRAGARQDAPPGVGGVSASVHPVMHADGARLG